MNQEVRPLLFLAVFACGSAAGAVGTAIAFSPLEAIETLSKTQNIFAAGVALIAAITAYLVQRAKILSDEGARESELQARSIAVAYRIEWVARMLASAAARVVETEAGPMLHAIWTRGFSRRVHNAIVQARATHAEAWGEISGAKFETIQSIVSRLATMDAMTVCARELCETLDDKPEDAFKGDLYSVDSLSMHILKAMELIVPGFTADTKPARPENLARFAQSIGMVPAPNQDEQTA